MDRKGHKPEITKQLPPAGKRRVPINIKCRFTEDGEIKSNERLAKAFHAAGLFD
jgi:hypothetical protein